LTDFVYCDKIRVHKLYKNCVYGGEAMDNEKDMSAVNREVPASAAERFEEWLTNRFWFYYRWYFLAAVFAVTILVFSLIGMTRNVASDWTVVYAHCGETDSAQVEELKELLESVLPETGENRRVDVDVMTLPLPEGGQNKYGALHLYGALNDQDKIIFVLDEAHYQQYTSLGYFEDGAPIASMPGLYCATNDAPVKTLSALDEKYAEYSQEFLDEVYLEFVAEHERFLSQAKEALAVIRE